MPWFATAVARCCVTGLAACTQERRRGCLAAAAGVEAVALSVGRWALRTLSQPRALRSFGATSPRAPPHPSSGQMDACLD